MTLRIFHHDGSMRVIDNVTHVLSHSAASAVNGVDLEVETREFSGYLILTEKIHIDKWDFYSVEP